MVEDKNNFDEVREAFEKSLDAGTERLYSDTLETLLKNMEEGKDALGNAWVPITEETLFNSREVRTDNRDPLVDTGTTRGDINGSSDVLAPGLAVIGTSLEHMKPHEFGAPEMGIPRRPVFQPAATYANNRVEEIYGDELEDRLDDAEL